MKKQLIALAAVFLFSLERSSSLSAQVVGAGAAHSMGVCTDNTARSWGGNFSGQLGNGTTTSSNYPVQVIVLTGVNAVWGAKSHSLFVKNDGTAWGCGQNFYGELGDGTTTLRTTAVQAGGLTGIIVASGGYGHSLFLKNNGTVWASGRNGSGQLGDGTTTQRTTAVQVITLTGITAITAGANSSLFLKNDGTVWGCGQNNNGALGDGTTTTPRLTPVQAINLTGVIAISAGGPHTLFLKSNGTVWSCGTNTSGELGDGTTVSRSTAVQVSGLTGIVAVAGGESHSLFRKNDGTVWACGNNSNGQLGDGTTTSRLTPVQVAGLTGVAAIAAGGYQSLFVKTNGTVWACGANFFGEIGDATSTQRITPVQVSSNMCSVNPFPVPTITAAPSFTICNGSSVTLSASVSGGIAPYTYSWIPGGASTTAITVNPTATTGYTLQVTSSGALSASTTATLTVNPRPAANAGADADIFIGSSVMIGGTPSAAGGTSPYTYAWTPSASLNSSTIANPVASPTVNTTYTLNVSDASSCSSSDVVTVFVRPDHSFAQLSKKLDGGFYKTDDGVLYFKYDEEYINGTLQFTVYNDDHVPQAVPFINSSLKSFGYNRYAISCITCDSSFPAGYYILEVVNAKNEIVKLRFYYDGYTGGIPPC